ncbi:ribonuclease Y [Microgenomates bacterium UTCPR1]|nr:MAG: ribonuclease Y [Microgenomates bacterium UTCPR1]
MLQKFFRKFQSIKQDRENLLSSAKKEAEELVNKARLEAQKLKEEAEKKAIETATNALEVERRLSKKEEMLEEKENQVSRERQSAQDIKNHFEKLKKEAEDKKSEMLLKLEKIAKMTKDEAKSLLLRGWEDRLKEDIAKKIKAAEEEIKAKADDKAKSILVDAMRYGAVDYTAEYTLSVINLPSEDYKGRIIGKDGRNIRAFEIATGVDVDLEEEGVIRLSSFDAARREIARLSLERLIKDGRIQPQRIEEIVKKAKEDIEKEIFKAGEDLAHRVGVFNLPAEITQSLGRFKYRFSYGQSLIVHTLEETKIGIALAHELGADVNVVKLGCLLHDIGKVIVDKEGSHVTLGVELLKKHRFPQAVVDCVAAHHEDIPFPSVEAIIVYISDAVSGGRPGARHEDFEEYLKRIKTIEDTAKSKKGVKEVYALQAGRELRVIVRPEEVGDDEATIMAEKIREELEQKFDVFPGQIKVTIIRETRAEATTKI